MSATARISKDLLTEFDFADQVTFRSIEHQILLHYNYLGCSIDKCMDNLAIITLKETQNKVIPICMPDPILPQPNSVDIIGYGGDLDQMSDQLVIANVKKMSYQDCKLDYGNYLPQYSYDQSFSEAAICYSGTENALCYEDSGGPAVAVIPSKNAAYHRYGLYGLMSFSHNYCQLNLPNIFINVRNYLDWINDAIQKNCYPREDNLVQNSESSNSLTKNRQNCLENTDTPIQPLSIHDDLKIINWKFSVPKCYLDGEDFYNKDFKNFTLNFSSSFQLKELTKIYEACDRIDKVNNQQKTSFAGVFELYTPYNVDLNWGCGLI